MTLKSGTENLEEFIITDWVRFVESVLKMPFILLSRFYLLYEEV